MSPSTLSTELESLRAGATVAPSIVVKLRKPRTRRKKAEVQPEATTETESAQPSSTPEEA
jgi:hypothetical protein